MFCGSFPAKKSRRSRHATAVCAFYGWALYDFLVPGDALDAPVWNVAELREANHGLGNFDLALELATRV